MAEKTEIKVETEEQFLAFLDRIDDKSFMELTDISSTRFEVCYKIEGATFDSSLPGSLILGLATYQEKIYKTYRLQKYGKHFPRPLSEEEKKELEIKVTVKPGCTEAVVTFARDMFLEAMKNMTGQELSTTIISVASVFIGAWAIKGIAAPIIQEKFKTKRAEIEAKKEQSKDEKEIKFLEKMETVTNNAIESMCSLAQGIVSSGPTSVTVDDKKIDIEEIAQIPERLRKEKPVSTKEDLPDIYSVEGSFKVLEINYEQDTTQMRALHIDSNTCYNEISLQDGWMTQKNMAILENAQARDPVFFRILAQRSGRKYKHAIDVNSIKEIEKE